MGGFSLGSSAGWSLQIDLVSVVHEAIQNCVCHCRISDPLVPLSDWQLARDDGRDTAVPVLDHLEQVVTLRVLRRPEAPVVEHEHVKLRELREQPCMGAFGAGKRELVE